MRILLAVDGSSCSEAAAGAIVAQFPREASQILVFHADEWPAGLPVDLSFAEGPTAAMEVIAAHEQRRKEADALVAGVAGRLRAAGFQTSSTVRPGDPRHGIVDAAKEWGADLIVLGSHGRRGVDRFLIGSVSEAVVRHAPCSVEVVRMPDVPRSEPRPLG